MSDKHKFTIRPLSRPGRSDFKDAFRIYFSASALVLLNLKPGDLCQIDSELGVPKTAIAWSAAEKIQETVVQTSKTLQEIYGLKLGDKVDITPHDGTAVEASEIYLQPDLVGEAETDTGDLFGEDKSHWEWFLEMPLSRAEWLAVGMTFDTDLKGQKRRFKIVGTQSVDSPQSSLFRFCGSSSAHIVNSEDLGFLETGLSPIKFKIDKASVGGVGHQIKQIERVLRRFGPLSSAIQLPSYYKPAQGLLLYGPKGTGKSLLIDSITKCSWKKIFRIETTGTRDSIANAIQKIFSDARKAQPGLIIIDQLDSLAPKRSVFDYNASSSVASALRNGFDSLAGTSILAVGETRHPNEIDETLRTPARFGVEVEVTVPTADERLEILQAIRGNSLEPSDHVLKDLSQRTHGYVGADLAALLNLCVELAEDRALASLSKSPKLTERPSTVVDGISPVHQNGYLSDDQAALPLQITDADIAQALTNIRPTALQEIFLSTPRTPWSSIGGYGSIKQHLQNTVSRPLQFPDQMMKLNLRPRKGLLLYGPPGCSKTLLVKALATESGLNFLAVKGAEVLSMYVGESERAVREIFRKARAASPSIIFFDEIDAVASTRSGGGGGGSSGINVLTTLLNELDGIEELRNVLVVAATNTPQTVDPALLRPGRLDHLLYVGLPDLEARTEILTNWLGKSQTSEELKIHDVIHTIAEGLHGYSGAEIIGICETAGSFAMDRYERLISNLDESLPQDQSERVVIERQDIEEARSRTRRGVSPDSVHAFEEWSKGRG